MELDQLEIFKSVLEEGSVSRAAVRLHRSKSLISRKLAALEEECGGNLFHRNGRGLVLSELGESILPQIELILSATKDLVQCRSKKKIVALEDVRLMTTPAISGILLSLFNTLRRSHPRIRLHISEGSSADAIHALKDNRVDVAVLLRPEPPLRDADLIIDEIDTYLVGRPEEPVMQRDEISFAALEGLPLMMPGPPSLCREALEKAAASRGVRLPIIANVNSPGHTLSLVAAGAGYLVAPVWLHAKSPLSSIDIEVRAGRLSAARIVEPRFTRDLVVRMGINRSPAVQAVAQQTAIVLHEAKQDRRFPQRSAQLTEVNDGL